MSAHPWIRSTTVGDLRADLESEKVTIIAAIEHAQVAGGLDPRDEREMRARFANIQAQLRTWR